MNVCRHCGRCIVNEDGAWVDPEATGDDSVWRETCDSHDTFVADHEPTDTSTTFAVPATVFVTVTDKGVREVVVMPATGAMDPPDAWWIDDRDGHDGENDDYHRDTLHTDTWWKDGIPTDAVPDADPNHVRVHWEP